MEKALKELFNKAKYRENPELARNIWHKIVLEDKRITNLKLWGFSVAGLFSLAGFVPVFKELSSNLAQSGLYEYLSLAFGNGGGIMSYWRELLLSIAESLPTTSIILSLSLIFILFLSLKYATRQIVKEKLLLSF